MLMVAVGVSGAQELPDPGLLAQARPFAVGPGSEGFTVAARLDPAWQAPGSPVVAAVAFSCPRGWYVFADSISLRVEQPAGVAPPAVARSLHLPQARSKYDELLGQQVSYLDGRFEAKLVLDIHAGAAQGDYPLNIVASFQGCSPALCFAPEDRSLPVSLRVLAPGAQPVPVALPEQTAPGEALPREAAARYEEQFAEHGLLPALVLAFVAGLGLALTPCLYPMIPVTIGVIGATATQGRLSALGRSLLYVLGISLTYASLGVVAAGTGRAFGTVLQHPAVYLGLGVVFAGLAGSLFDLYRIELPGTWTGRLQARLRGRAGLAGVLLLGILSGLAVSPCSAPVVFAAMGYVLKTHNVLAGFLIFFAIAWGMGAPLVMLGTFSGLLRSLPRSGGWQVAVKRIFGLGLLAGAVYFVWMSAVLPEPWFYMFLGAMLAAISVFVGAFDRIDLSRRTAGWWPRLKKAAGLLVLVGAVACFVQSLRLPRPIPQGIAWLTSEADAAAAAVHAGRPVMLYFWQERCPVCRRLEASTFRDPGVLQESKRFVAVKFDGTDARAAHVKAVLEKYRVRGFPTIVFISADGRVLYERTVVGYVDAEHLAGLMRTVPASSAGG